MDRWAICTAKTVMEGVHQGYIVCEKQRKCGDAKLSCEGKKEVPVGAIHKWGGPCGHL